MALKRLLRLHAGVTLAAAFILIAFPGLIPASININVRPEAYVLSYLLAAAELSIAFLSFFAAKIGDHYALKIIVTSFMVFHGATAWLELYALFQGASVKLAGNITLRLVIVLLFAYYGFYRDEKLRIKKRARSRDGPHL